MQVKRNAPGDYTVTTTVGTFHLICVTRDYTDKGQGCLWHDGNDAWRTKADALAEYAAGEASDLKGN